MFDKLFVKITVHDWLDEVQFESLVFFLLMITALEHAYLANNLQFCIFLETFCHAINEWLSFASYYTDWLICRLGCIIIAYVASNGLFDLHFWVSGWLYIYFTVSVHASDILAHLFQVFCS